MSNAKTDVKKKQEIKEIVVIAIYFNFLQEVPSKLEIMCGIIFQLILLGIPSNLILSVKNRSGGQCGGGHLVT